MFASLKRGSRTSVAAGLSVAVALAVTACGGDEPSSQGGWADRTSTPTSDMQQLIDAAKAEGSVTFYGTPEEQKVRDWVKAFTDLYGIDVEIYRAPSVEVYQRYSQEESAGRHLADLVTLSVPNYITDAADRGWAAQYKPQTGDTFKQDFVGEGVAYPLYVTTHAVAWNTNQIPEAEAQAIQDDPFGALLNPKYKGHIALVTAAAGGGQMSAYYGIVNDPDLGWDYLKALAAQDPVVVNSAVTMASDLAAGEYWLAFPSSDTTVWPQVQKGAPLEFAYVPNGYSSTHQMFISAKAPHPAAARLFMEWATSADSQNSLANISGGAVATSLWNDTRDILNEPWYAKPENDVDMTWASDPDFLSGVEQLTQDWLDTFGQS